jgi:hypothetical protein
MIAIGFKIGLGLFLSYLFIYLVIFSPFLVMAGLSGIVDAIQNPENLMAAPSKEESHKDDCQPNDETLIEELKGIWPRLKWALLLGPGALLVLWAVSGFR